MISFLKKVLNRQKAPNYTSFSSEEIYKFIITDYSNLNKEVPAQFYDYLESGEYHGLILKNVLSKEEVATILKNLNSIPKGKKIFNDKNNLYPRGFSSYTQKKLEDDDLSFKLYFEEGKRYIDDFNQEFEVKIGERLQKIFNYIGNDRPFNFLYLDEKGAFPHSQFRTLYPKVGLFPVHCENCHLSTFNSFYDHLDNLVHVKNHKSYFILLNKPQRGGEILLFDIQWEEGQQWRPVDMIQLSNGKVIDPIKDKHIKKMLLEVNEGDMVLFSGGNIWHKVTRIMGSKDRITLGGFFSTTKENNHITCWA